MKRKLGEYFYAPYNKKFRIYKYDVIDENVGFSSAEPVEEEPFYEKEKMRRNEYMN